MKDDNVTRTMPVCKAAFDPTIYVSGMNKLGLRGADALLRMGYYDTYHFAEIIHSLVHEPELDESKIFDGFLDDTKAPAWALPFPKWTSLHRLTESTFRTLLDESVDDVMEDGIANDPQYQPWVTVALRHHDVRHPDVREWLTGEGISLRDFNGDDIHRYHEFLYATGPLRFLIKQITEEAFFLLFLNRSTLLRFHERIADRLRLNASVLGGADSALVTKGGTLRRKTIPQWAKQAVFHRDRGLCSHCHRDISGLVSLQAAKCFDHMVPLALGGTNEITNLQLLCPDCNRAKGGVKATAGEHYERWYR